MNAIYLYGLTTYFKTNISTIFDTQTSFVLNLMHESLKYFYLFCNLFILILG